jgi:PAS domain S-box-containing protein
MIPLRQLRQFRAVLLTAVLGVLFSVGLFLLARHWETERLRSEFVAETAEAAEVLVDRVLDNLSVLEFLAALYAANQTVDRRQFQDFVRTAFTTQPGTLALEWIPRVSDAARAAYEAGVRREGFPGFQIMERSPQSLTLRAGRRNEYFPVHYIEPSRGNEAALGFDLGSEPVRRLTLEAARDTGRAVATERITLVQGTGTRYGFLALRPIYRGGAVPGPPETRREQLIGFVAGVFRVEDMMRAALRGLVVREVGLRVFDVTNSPTPVLLFTRGAESPAGPGAPGGEDAAARRGLTRATTIQVAGRQWSVRFDLPPESLAGKRGWSAWGALAGSLAFTLLLAGYLRSLLSRTTQVERLVEERTADLTVTAARLRESEEHFRALFEEAPVAYHEIDLTGVVRRVNRAECALLGYAPGAILGRPIWEFVAPEEREQSREAVRRKLAGEQPFLPFTREYQRQDGSRIIVEIHEGLIRDAAGRVVGIRSALTDISHRRAVERMKDEFISVVSHELRTPLTSIRGALGLLASGRLGTLPEAGGRMLEIAVSNTDRLVRLINDILDIERMESGRVRIQRVSCAAERLMVQAAEELRPLAEKAGVRLTVTPAPVEIWADPDRILQTLTNLLSNAIKFSPVGTTVSLCATPEADVLCFRVRDQGRGIPADKLETIFGRFQQVDASDTREKGGTGLGLAICKSIVEQHGGRIWVESAPGQGSTFCFTLPLRSEAPPQEQAGGGGAASAAGASLE